MMLDRRMGWAGHEKRCALPSPEFSLNARIPTLPNCVQEGEFNLAKHGICKLHCLCHGRGSTEHCRIATLAGGFEFAAYPLSYWKRQHASL
ncbi:hypothetical protein RB7195 [Rhodopirellula baltica SH 1]|uniref:Uncharacterized protein n=1 Tax=Rhodopirellula baltica (strain DSM 10527 / NCIMB 13988 / SH1) TaxID=243090 RepID=Q7UP33_RHOBA|nr:hypothetical protein RB7195 [Rhodopirellula baltica SH 1]